jgi:hypothetical protein
MILRFLLVLTLALIGAPASAAPAGVRSTLPEPPAPPMAFYIVKGAPDACGRGCDSWIAAEGQIDSGAAARFRKFLNRVRGRNLPIYFSSPGGNLDQALAMGAMLRERPAVARVARTVVRECGFEAQNGDTCLKLKQSGLELHGDLWTRGATCNSACPYLILGATSREIAPDAVLGVHSPKVIVRFSGTGVPTAEMRSAATARGLERADRMLMHYVVKMGAEPGLLAIASTTKFEDMHVLTRDEIVRFGIDRREFVETPWTFENGGRSMVRKMIVQKNDADKSFRLSQWRLLCSNTEQFELAYQRQAVVNAVFPTVSISNGGQKPLFLSPASSRPAGFDLWFLRMNKASVQSLTALPQLDFTETSQASDGRRLARSLQFSSEGLAGALDSLLATCPVPKSIAPLRTMGSRDSAPK